MIPTSEIDAAEFVASVKPLLKAKDLPGLLCHLRANWSAEQIASLLSSGDHDARKVAALSLALVGRKCCIPALAQRLRDGDAMTNQIAEHALWSIWFRSGSPPANAELATGAQCLSIRDFDCAFDHFNRALEICPDFAEAYNQRATAWYLLENYDRAAADYQRAAELMPYHFGAWSGLGHCYAHLGRIPDAIAAYERAISINPHLDCCRQTVCELKKQIRFEA